MTKDTLIKETLKTLSKLPDRKVKEVSEFASLLLKKHDEEIIQSGIEILVSKSQTYSFLEEEEDLYTVEDLKERYK